MLRGIFTEKQFKFQGSGSLILILGFSFRDICVGAVVHCVIAGERTQHDVIAGERTQHGEDDSSLEVYIFIWNMTHKRLEAL